MRCNLIHRTPLQRVHIGFIHISWNKVKWIKITMSGKKRLSFSARWYEHLWYARMGNGGHTASPSKISLKRPTTGAHNKVTHSLIAWKMHPLAEWLISHPVKSLRSRLLPIKLLTLLIELFYLKITATRSPRAPGWSVPIVIQLTLPVGGLLCDQQMLYISCSCLYKRWLT